MSIPKHPDDITPGWLMEHLGWDVTHVDVHEIGAGIGVSSAVYRARLTGNDVPPTVVVKLTAIDPAAAFTSTVLSMYRREAAFFNDLSSDMPVRVPGGHYAEVSDDGAEFVVVMEDLSGNRMLDQTQVMSDVDAERCIDTLASWHANWWNRVDGVCESGVAVALSDPMYPAMLPGLFDEGWAKLCTSGHCVPPDALQPVGPKFAGAVEGLLQTLSHGPVTLLHGDFRTDNMMFDADDNLILMDFQLTSVGSAAYDVAYFVGSCLDIDAERERELYDRWIAGLVAGGVPTSDLDDMWEKYRVAALFCLVYPVVASRGMDLEVPREQALVNVMMSRQARGAVDLDWMSLLD
jgi:aminoglycoside phosphotransferase (APT) family kinase protein